ncbi:uncharacterized protein Fot_09905 [Forsythia ovata]|uniref:Uncharacterized protein n=1 Tax=Forsythia ovata TaxID=205694 RepID=A0ABD1WJ03_9LAMI
MLIPYSSAQVELREPVTENEESSWQQLTGVPFSEWTDGRGWQGNSANQWFQETFGNDDVEHGQMQESHEDWQGHDLQEAIDSWLDVPSGEDSASIERSGGVYFPDDDNVLQSHVERQGHASSDWELDNASSSLASTEQVEEHINGDQDSAQLDGTERNPFLLSSPLGNALQPLLDHELQDSNWPCNNSEQHLGIVQKRTMNVLVFGVTINRCTDYQQKFLLQETWIILKPERLTDSDVDSA